MTPSEKHHQLARDFVMKVAGETSTYSEMMVVIETALLASMLILQQRHGFKPAGCAEFIESAVHAATERFTQQVKR